MTEEMPAHPTVWPIPVLSTNRRQLDLRELSMGPCRQSCIFTIVEGRTRVLSGVGQTAPSTSAPAGQP